MRKTRVAVVGVGYLGKFHAQKYARMPNAELVGVVDIDEKLAKQVAAENQTEAISDYRELFGKVDAASVVVPTPYHFGISRDLLAHKIDLMIEKPITTSLAEADKLIDLADSQNRSESVQTPDSLQKRLLLKQSPPTINRDHASGEHRVLIP